MNRSPHGQAREPEAPVDPKPHRFRVENIDGQTCLTALSWRDSGDTEFLAARVRLAEVQKREAPWLVAPLRLERHGKAERLVMALPSGQPLSKNRPSDVLPLSIKLANALVELHDAGLIHGSLSPETVFVDGDRLQLVLVPDSLHPNHGDALYDRTDLRELPFIAPEQTGRITTPTDRRADLYGLGALLFWMTEGHAPFTSTERMDLVHQIIAVPAPEAPTHRRPCARLSPACSTRHRRTVPLFLGRSRRPAHLPRPKRKANPDRRRRSPIELHSTGPALRSAV